MKVHMNECPIPFSEISRTIKGVLCSNRLPAISPCPVCGTHTTEGLGHPKSVGFRRAAHNRHVFCCVYRALAHYGYTETRYDADLEAYPLEEIKPVPFKIRVPRREKNRRGYGLHP